MSKAQTDKRRWYQKLALRGQGVPVEDRIWAGQTQGMLHAAAALQLPASIDTLTPMVNAAGAPVFVAGVSVVGGPDPAA